MTPQAPVPGSWGRLRKGGGAVVAGSGDVPATTAAARTPNLRGKSCVRQSGAAGRGSRLPNRYSISVRSSGIVWAQIGGSFMRCHKQDTARRPPGTSVTIRGLRNGTEYTFTMKASNAVGTRPLSAQSNAGDSKRPSVTPMRVPGTRPLASVWSVSPPAQWNSGTRR